MRLRARCRPATMLAAVGVLVLAGCGGDGGPASTASPSAPALTGTQWVLDEAGPAAQGASVTASLRFDGGQVNGSDGCNTLAGPYTVDGAALRIGPLAGTQRACVGPADAVAATVQAGLTATRRYAIADGVLTLLDASGGRLLTYRASTPGVGGAWTVTSVLYDDAIRGVLDGTTLTADFGADGRLSGNGGCNGFSGAYTAQGTSLRITALTATEMACARPPGADEQEQGYFAALRSVRTFEQVGDTLTLLDGQGRMAVTLGRDG